MICLLVLLFLQIKPKKVEKVSTEGESVWPPQANPESWLQLHSSCQSLTVSTSS